MLSTCSRKRLEYKKCKGLKGNSQSLSNKPQSVFSSALMPKSCWPRRCDLTNRHLLNSPVGRFSSLWVILQIFQVLAAGLSVRPGGSRALQQPHWKAGATRRIQTPGPLMLCTPQPWPNVETLQAAVSIIQIICHIKVKCHQEGTQNSNTAEIVRRFLLPH